MTNWSKLQEFDRWSCVQRLPSALRTLMENRGNTVFVAGGYIRSCVSGEPINDIDVFVNSSAVAEDIAFTLHKAGGTVPTQTPNSWSLKLGLLPIQIIHRWEFTDPRMCAESFDFTIAKSAIWCDHYLFSRRWETLCHPDFYADLAAKRLVYTSPERNEDAGGSILRVLKFYQRGYRIPLDSMGAVISRLMYGTYLKSKLGEFKMSEYDMGHEITALLRVVDPSVDPFAAAHIDTPGEL